MMRKLGAAMAAIAAFVATGVSAENYFGFAVETMSVDSESEFGETSESSLSGVSAILGRTYEADGFFWGFEGSVTANLGGAFDLNGTECSTIANGPYMCEQDSSVRVYALIGKTFGDYDIYGKLGYGAAFGDFAVSSFDQESGSIRGQTIAVGAARQVEGNGKVFAELIYDDFGDSGDQPGGYSSDYNAMGLRIGFTQPF